jgi:exopolysaccharide biosynthesis polyprenyl glycosylphosphotransferase
VALPVQLAAAGLVGVGTALAVGAPGWLTAVLLSALALTVPAGDRGSMRAGWLDLERLVGSASLTLAGLTVAVALTELGEKALWQSTAIVSAATAALLVGQVVVRLMPRPLRLVLVGGPAEVASAHRAHASRPDLTVAGMVVVASGGDGPWPGDGAVPVSDDLAGVRALATGWGADAVVVLPGGAVGAVTVQWLSWALEGSRIRLAIGAGYDGVARHRMHLTSACGTTFTRIGPSRPSAVVSRVKAAQDRVLGAVLLALVAPLLGLLTVLVRLDSRGPAIFRQTRVGLHGRPFTMLKLRTMCLEAESVRADLTEQDQGNGVLFKMHADPRVTRVGRVLRGLSLDELPQLVNVVRGEMSLVGPRPALPSEVAAYDERARRRLAVRPGMTGLWQVRGRSNLSWDESVALDLHYTDNITLARDLAICVETIRAVASRKGAY